MEFSQINPIRLEEHLQKCRCCLRTLNADQKFVQITESFEQKFYELTAIELIESEFLSKRICSMCSNDLAVFSQFRKDLIMKQNILYQALQSRPVLNDLSDVKSETTDFVECNQSDEFGSLDQTNNDIFQPQVIIKSENFDNFHGLTLSLSERFKDKPWPELNLSSPKQHRRSKQSKTVVQENVTKERVICAFCGFTFSNKKAWYQHNLRLHSESFKFTCDFCGKGYNIKSDLKIHIKIHMNVESREKFPCTSCGVCLLSLKALQNHEQNFHSNVVEEHFCECGQVFSSKAKLYQHRSEIHNESFPCPFCFRSYRNKKTLKLHKIKDHAKKVPCTVCSKMFSPGLDMNRHLKNHAPPQLKCTYDDCTKVFSRTSELKHHIEANHEPTATVNCPTCNGTFNTGRNLKRHIARQHSAHRFHCEVAGCSHSTARKEYLRSHYRSHKNIDEETRNALLEKVQSIKI